MFDRRSQNCLRILQSILLKQKNKKQKNNKTQEEKKKTSIDANIEISLIW